MPEDFVRSSLPRYGRVPRGLLRNPNLSDRAARLYGLLDDYAGADGKAFPARATLAEACGCSVDTIDRTLTELDGAGWLIKVPRRRDDGGQTSTLYVLTDGGVGGPVDNPLEESRGGRTHAAPPSAPVRPHEGTTTKEPPISPPAGGEHAVADPEDDPLPIDVAPVGPVRDNVNMSMTAATTTTRRREVPDDDPHWSAFWSLYPRKLSKGAARKAWARAIAKEDPAVILRAAEKFAGTVKELRFCPYPGTWLNQEKWNDEAGTDRPTTGRGHPRSGTDEECPQHVGEWAHNCRPCASERIARE